jgi:archaetidylinositol phosphate synthase
MMNKTTSESGDSKRVPPPRTPMHAFARWCIRPLVHTWVMPNHITTLRLLTGIAAAAAFSVGNYYWSVWGGVIFAISAILDRADGELARVADLSTPAGHWYDLACDTIVNVLVFIGIGVGVRERIGLWGPIMGGVAGLSVGATFLVVFRLHALGSHPSLAFNAPSGFDFDDALFLVAICAWCKVLLPLLVISTIAAPLFLIFAFWRSREVFTRQAGSTPVPCTTPPHRGQIPGSNAV